MQLSGAMSIGLMVEWTNSYFYLSQMFTYWICSLASNQYISSDLAYNHLETNNVSENLKGV